MPTSLLMSKCTIGKNKVLRFLCLAINKRWWFEVGWESSKPVINELFVPCSLQRKRHTVALLKKNKADFLKNTNESQIG